MHPIVEHLITAYPSPVPGDYRKKMGARMDAYCVGGSLCLAYPDMVDAYPRPFPNPADLADWLVALNPDLTWTIALNFAARITHNNDASTFARAYEVLDQALSYSKE